MEHGTSAQLNNLAIHSHDDVHEGVDPRIHDAQYATNDDVERGLAHQAVDYVPRPGHKSSDPEKQDQVAVDVRSTPRPSVVEGKGGEATEQKEEASGPLYVSAP